MELCLSPLKKRKIQTVDFRFTQDLLELENSRDDVILVDSFFIDLKNRYFEQLDFILKEVR